MNEAAVEIVLAQFDPGAEANTLLNILAWCATAAGVLGLIFVGITLAMQAYSGQPGAGAMYLKQFAYVVLACVLAATAGPLVAFLGF